MRVVEVGIMARGYPLVYSKYLNIERKQFDIILKTAILTGIMNFVKGFFSIEALEYIESGKYIVVFEKSCIIAKNSSAPETIYAYLIMSNKKKHHYDKFITKRIHPYLSMILKKFKRTYEGIELSSVYKFNSFRVILDKIFKKAAMTTEEKFMELF